MRCWVAVRPPEKFGRSDTGDLSLRQAEWVDDDEGQSSPGEGCQITLPQIVYDIDHPGPP
jgi:hypothetical protein